MNPVKISYYGVFMIGRTVYFSLFAGALVLFVVILAVMLALSQHIPFFGLIFGFTFFMALLQVAEGIWFHLRFKKAEQKLRDDVSRRV